MDAEETTRHDGWDRSSVEREGTRAQAASAASLKMGNYIVAYRIEDQDLYAIQNITTRQIILGNDIMLTKLRRAIGGENPSSIFGNDGLLEGLQAGGFILPASVSEVEIVRMEEMKNRFGHPEYMELWIAPTYDCNMSCSYCAQNHVTRGRGSMSVEVQDAILTYLENVFPMKQSASFCWYGGEPLLTLGIIDRLGKKIRELGESHGVRVYQRMITNGTLLDDPTVAVLRALDLVHVQITVHTIQEYHDRFRYFRNGAGTWNTIIDNIEKHCDDLRIKIRVNLSRENEAYLDDFLALLDKRGILGRAHVSLAIASCFEGYDYVDQSRFPHAQEIDPAVFEDTLLRLMGDTEVADKVGASAYRSVIVPINFMQCSAKIPDSFLVGPRGELYKCAVVFGDPEEEVGSILSKTFPNKALESRYLGHDVSEDCICVGCLAYPACRGGCLVSHFKSENLETRCFISVPRWEKVLGLHLKEITGSAPSSLTLEPLYPEERRLGERLLKSSR